MNICTAQLQLVGATWVNIQRIWQYLSLFLILAGLWHGAGLTFIVFGGLHGIALVYEISTKKIRKIWEEDSKIYLQFSISCFDFYLCKFCMDLF